MTGVWFLMVLHGLLGLPDTTTSAIVVVMALPYLASILVLYRRDCEATFSEYRRANKDFRY